MRVFSPSPCAVIALAIAVLMLPLSARGQVADTRGPQESATPRSSGRHDATSRHSFADVEKWTQVFDDPGRDAWQKPREVIAALGLQPGMAVADLGAGTGYFSRHLFEAVGETGAVFAVDTEPNLVVHLRKRAEEERTGVIPVLASLDNPRLPAARLDLVLVVDTYHHIDDRLTYFRNLQRALTPGGRVAIIDWHKRALPVGPPVEHKLARAQVVEEMNAAGYDLAQELSVLPYQYFAIFRPR